MSENFSPYVDSVRETCSKKADKDGSYAVAVALFEIAEQLGMLGFGRSTHPGAIEGHTMKMMESISSVSSNFELMATTLDKIAITIEEKEMAST